MVVPFEVDGDEAIVASRNPRRQPNVEQHVFKNEQPYRMLR
jgi:hypothetical protein